MDDFNKNCGRRLKKIRMIFNEGRKLSAEQFAHLLDESRDRISNYESGRSQIPIRLLSELYNRGINPVFLISGEGNIFADTKTGQKLLRAIEAKSRIDKETRDNYEDLKNESLYYKELESGKTLKAAAGNIKVKK